MEAHSFSSRITIDSLSSQIPKVLNSQSSSSSSRSSKPTNTTQVFNFLDDFSLVETALSSYYYLVDTPSPFLSMSSSSIYDLSLQDESDEKVAMDANDELVKPSSLKSGRVAVGKGLEPLKDSTGRLYPPPITCLKLFKTGKPYTYLTFKEDDGSFVFENIKIPNRDILHASRAEGRLKLYFDTSADEF
ncbi:uncharacterized protein LOC112534278 [Ricinus communis]|uniref:FAF domain-containing protein n=1 Tax=Ricinus communis TaxID=3988 RepID=B9RPT9_RICCO|nr:uncharacterized protein LOC112534278 [Ricinus communis]EEF46597.1 conserved hypothetical protein [Ricinus communis]|eukprot:XP_025012533.1 uncharacterized protein LOC112534278 [Ricinus communis]